MCKRPSAWLAHEVSWANWTKRVNIGLSKGYNINSFNIFRMHTYVFTCFISDMSMSTLISLLA